MLIDYQVVKDFFIKNLVNAITREKNVETK
jgi:hypothetical protein